MRIDPKSMRQSLLVDPIQDAYQAYSSHLHNKDRSGRPLKRWHELAAVERAAWRQAFLTFFMAGPGGGRVPVNRPEPDQVTLVVGDEHGAYVFQPVPRALLEDPDNHPAIRDHVLPNLDRGIRQLHADRSARHADRPSQ